MTTKKITAPTMADLLSAIYEAHGWTRQPGESRTAKVKTIYDLALDYKSNRFIATKRRTDHD